MMAPNSNLSNNLSNKASPSSHWGITLEKKEPIDGPHFQTNRELKSDIMVKKRITVAVHDTTDKSSSIKGDINFNIDSATTAKTNNLSNKASPSSPWGIALEKKEPIDGPRFQKNRDLKTDLMVEKRINEAVHDTTDKSSDIRGDIIFNVDSATTAKTSPLIKNNNEQESNEYIPRDHINMVPWYIQQWERGALSHFRNSAWKDVIRSCKKVLQVPGQDKTNFDVLYKIGYAHMRLGEYQTAVNYFMGAHRIDSQRVSLRLVMRDLRSKITTGPWRKRSRENESSEQQQVSKKVCSSEPKMPM